MKNLIKEYEEIFLESPKYYLDTGGRFEIIGNHTDHNHGLCIVANCSLRIKAVLDKDDEIVDIKSKGYDRFSFSLSSLSNYNDYENKTKALVAGILIKLKELGYTVHRLDLEKLNLKHYKNNNSKVIRQCLKNLRLHQ